VKQAARIAGLREVASIRAAKMVPIPTPAPMRPIAARPAPMNLADCIARSLLGSLPPWGSGRDCIDQLPLPSLSVLPTHLGSYPSPTELATPGLPIL